MDLAFYKTIQQVRTGARAPPPLALPSQVPMNCFSGETVILRPPALFFYELFSMGCKFGDFQGKLTEKCKYFDFFFENVFVVKFFSFFVAPLSCGPPACGSTRFITELFLTSAIVRLRVHFSRHCDFNQLSDRSIITLFMLIHVKEETLRVIFQTSFSKSDAQKLGYGVKRTSKMGCW